MKNSYVQTTDNSKNEINLKSTRVPVHKFNPSKKIDYHA